MDSAVHFDNSRWRATYLLDSVICLLKNWAQMFAYSHVGHKGSLFYSLIFDREIVRTINAFYR